MYKICRTEQSAARQKMFEQRLLQAMLSRDYEDISISDLCDQLQVPRKSFYRYFSSKDGALQALLDHTLLEFVQEDFRKGDRSTAMGELESFFVFWYAHRDLIKALVRSRLVGILVERATYHAIHERMMPQYLLSKPLEVQQMALTFTVCGLLSMVLQWHNHNYRETPGEIARIASMMLAMPLIQK
ncbi:MAG: TetR/AcrR family transcriptional regulator [Oscillospiraceae bacterium]|nr:TetR/AcrR family transcriptional regulator [Oscillospiraceae bacterium]